MHPSPTTAPPISKAERPSHPTPADQEADDFLAAIAHELKNPLNLIQLNVELLLRISATGNLPQVARAAESIRRAVLQQAQAIDEMADVAMLDRAALPLNRHPMDWSVAVRNMLDAVAGEAQRKQVSVSAQLPAGAAMIDADQERIEQIVWNLLTNALKATPAGGSVVVALTLNGAHAELEVRDTGRGIAPQSLPFVFDLSRPGSSSGAARRSGGLGVGMALVRRLAEAHGGEVEVSSEGLDQGACFVVRLPTTPPRDFSPGLAAPPGAA